MAVINSSLPSSWRDLQQQVAAVLRECGLHVTIERGVKTPRDTVNIDVYAEDHTQKPKTIYLCECKYWQSAVPKTVVHAFRTVVGDFGANWGFIISSSGFQRGAYEAAVSTNVHLVNWEEFQELFVDRWIETYMLGQIREAAEPLVDYTDINTGVLRKAVALSPEANKRLRELRDQHAHLASFALLQYSCFLKQKRLNLPLKRIGRSKRRSDPKLPGDLLEVSSYRDFLACLRQHLRKATSEFDQLFHGGGTLGL